MSASIIDFINKDNINIVEITATGSYNKPSNLSKAIVILTGGGAPGGATGASVPNVSNGAGGGGAGATVIKQFDESDLSASETVTIGGSGTNSTFGALLTANAGTAGALATGGVGTIGGAGGVASGGDFNIDGGQGGGGVGTNASNIGFGGLGGGSYWGSGASNIGAGNVTTTNGIAATLYGCGGSGAATGGNSGAGVGGAGADGVCMIIEILNP